MSIKKYDLHEYDGGVYESEDGEYCKSEDVEKLINELRDKDALIVGFDKKLEKAYQDGYNEAVGVYA